jgi:hypothetical protein
MTVGGRILRAQQLAGNRVRIEVQHTCGHGGQRVVRDHSEALEAARSPCLDCLSDRRLRPPAVGDVLSRVALDNDRLAVIVRHVCGHERACVVEDEVEAVQLSTRDCPDCAPPAEEDSQQNNA